MLTVLISNKLSLETATALNHGMSNTNSHRHKVFADQVSTRSFSVESWKSYYEKERKWEKKAREEIEIDIRPYDEKGIEKRGRRKGGNRKERSSCIVTVVKQRRE